MTNQTGRVRFEEVTLILVPYLRNPHLLLDRSDVGTFALVFDIAETLEGQKMNVASFLLQLSRFLLMNFAYAF
jgi:hypothetical protein